MQLSRLGREALVNAMVKDPAIDRTDIDACFDSAQALLMSSEYVDLHAEDEDDVDALVELADEITIYIFGETI